MSQVVLLQRSVGTMGEDDDIDVVEPLPPLRRKTFLKKQMPNWAGNAVNIFVAALIIFAIEISLPLYRPVYDDSALFEWIVRFIEVQLLLNMAAIRLSSKKDNACYQLIRLGISSRRLELRASQKSLDKEGNSIQAHKHCDLCDRTVPFRSVHCAFCGFCSLRNDHHCFAVGTCIGVATLRYFVAFGCYLFAVGSWGLYLFIEVRRDKTNDDGTWSAYLTSAGSVVVNLLGVHALGLNLVRWFYQGYRLSLQDIPFCISYLLSLMSFMSGATIVIMQTFFLCKGYSMMEYFLVRDKIRGDGGTFMERVRFLFGRRFWLNWTFPRVWEDVEWSEVMISSHFDYPLHPVRADV